MEILWAAGFYDGEGNLRRDKTGRIRFQISQVNRMPLERFQQAVGKGVIRGPYGPYLSAGQRNPFYKYEIDGKGDILEVVDRLRPWLCPCTVIKINLVLENH